MPLISLAVLESVEEDALDWIRLLYTTFSRVFQCADIDRKAHSQNKSSLIRLVKLDLISAGLIFAIGLLFGDMTKLVQSVQYLLRQRHKTHWLTEVAKW